MEENEFQLNDQVKELILLLNKKNCINSDRKNAQWRVSYYKKIHQAKKQGNKYKKWDNHSLSDINLLILKNEAKVLKSRIKILSFNKKFSKRINTICQENGARVRHNTSNFTSLLVYSCGQYAVHLKSDEIRKIAKEYETTLAVENMLTKE
jgi:hypothetical protein